jgi:hypothetical protein
MTHVTGKAEGHTVLLLVRYCYLNPTELMQSQIGGYVARNNASFRLQEIRSLLETAVQNVVAEKWPHCVQHAVRDDDLLWELDGPNDNGVQRFCCHREQLPATIKRWRFCFGHRPSAGLLMEVRVIYLNACPDWTVKCVCVDCSAGYSMRVITSMGSGMRVMPAV